MTSPTPSGFHRETALHALAWVGGVWLLTSSRALAHDSGGEAEGLAAGFLHPVSGFDHVLAMVAVGLWGAQLRSPAVWVLPIVFPLVMAVGGFLGLVGIPLPGVEIGIAVSAIVLGILVAIEARLPLWVAGIIVAIFAIFHGYAHGAELPEGGNAALYSVGFVISTGLLHGIGILIGLIHRWSAGKLVLRLLGGLVAIGGGYFLWQALAQ